MLDCSLSERKNLVLMAVLDSFIDQGEPLGSRSLSKKYDIGVSPATIRNEMSDLEDLGYLLKSHSSSGRIPSDQAYRAYVDHIIQSIYGKMDLAQTGLTLAKPSLTSVEGEKLIRSSAKLLADLTGYVTVSVFVRPEGIKLVHLDLVPLNAHHLALVLLYETGEVSNSTIYLREMPSEGALKKLNFYLNTQLVGRSLADLRSHLKDYWQAMTPEIQQLFGLVQEEEANSIGKLDISIESLSSIFRFPEYQDLAKAKKFIEFIEDKQNIADIFYQRSGDYLSVEIGEENQAEVLKHNTLLSSSFFSERHLIGKILVIAPTRMKYRETIEAMMALSWRINHLES